MIKKYNSISLQIKLPEDIVKKMDELIQKHEFDTRSSLMRKAIVEFLKNYEQKIIVS